MRGRNAQLAELPDHVFDDSVRPGFRRVGQPAVVCDEAVLAAQPPLTLEEWKAMTDLTEKYDGATLERLRTGNPELKSDRAWDKYQKEFVAPQLVKDKPLKERI